MKQLVLQPMPLFIVAGALLSLSSSCTKQPSAIMESPIVNEMNAFKINSITDITTVNPFTKRVGAPIDGALGTSWIANYKNKNGFTQTCTLNNSYLQSLASQANCVGICLYYALKADNTITIVPIGIDDKGKIIKSLSITTTQGNISWVTAQQWIGNYKGTIKAHFFGSFTFDRLNVTPCQTIRVDFAINDEGKQQLLLSNTCMLNLTKQYEDRSNFCPPNCPGL
jgi:hypothetical protein